MAELKEFLNGVNYGLFIGRITKILSVVLRILKVLEKLNVLVKKGQFRKYFDFPCSNFNSLLKLS